MAKYFRESKIAKTLNLENYSPQSGRNLSHHLKIF